MSTETPKTDRRRLWEVLAAGFAFTVIVILWSRYGRGEIESLFTGLGFWGLLITIGIQLRQIRETKEDLARTMAIQESISQSQEHTAEMTRANALLEGLPLVIDRLESRRNAVVRQSATYGHLGDTPFEEAESRRIFYAEEDKYEEEFRAQRQIFSDQIENTLGKYEALINQVWLEHEKSQKAKQAHE